MIPRKACSCGRSFSAAEWRALPLGGYQDFGDQRLELRHCSGCGSTRAVEVPSSKLLHELAHLAWTEAAAADDEDDRAHLTEIAAEVDSEAFRIFVSAIEAA